MPMHELITFLRGYHDEVMACEARGLAALNKGDKETFLKEFRLKAEKMVAILTKATPYMEGLPAAEKDTVYHALRRFSNSANNGLHLGSPFYWTALLWNDDSKKGDPDNLQVFIDELEKRAGAQAKG